MQMPVRVRVLLLATVPPRDGRPDAAALHLTSQTYTEMLRMAFAALAELPGAELIVKLHPRSGDDPAVRALRAEFRGLRSWLVRRGRLEEWLAGVRCVLSCGSSAGVEATLAGVPVIQLAPRGGSGFLPHDRWGLAGTARSEGELRELLGQVLAEERRARQGPAPGVFGDFARPAAARVADEVLAAMDRQGIAGDENGVARLVEDRDPSESPSLPAPLPASGVRRGGFWTGSKRRGGRGRASASPRSLAAGGGLRPTASHPVTLMRPTASHPVTLMRPTASHPVEVAPMNRGSTNGSCTPAIAERADEVARGD